MIVEKIEISFKKNRQWKQNVVKKKSQKIYRERQWKKIDIEKNEDIGEKIYS